MPKERLLFVDLLRGLAVMVMIEVHAVNGLMRPAYRESLWFAPLDFINGLVAPVFLFLAGFAFHVAVQRNSAALRTWGPALRKTLARIGLIWLLGYLLHIPSFSLRSWYRDATTEQWQHFFSIDILQCIACGLLLLLLLRLIVTRDRIFLGMVTLLGCAAVVPASGIYQMDLLTVLPLWFASYIAPVSSTLFPLLPWFGFMAAGVLVSCFFLRAAAQGREDHFLYTVAGIGWVLVLVCLPLLAWFNHQLGVLFDERPHVLFFAARLGGVCILLGLCYWLCRGRETLSPSIVCAGQETLMIYCIHLQVLYRPIWQGHSLVELVAQRFSVTASLLSAIVLVGVMLVVARLWQTWKKHYDHVHRNGMVLAFVGGMLVFLFR
jgi:uncharacterized membrane protein